MEKKKSQLLYNQKNFNNSGIIKCLVLGVICTLKAGLYLSGIKNVLSPTMKRLQKNSDVW